MECASLPTHGSVGDWGKGVCMCVCGGMLEKKKKESVLYVCVGGKGVGFSDVRMTSAAEGRCVKDTPASRGPLECVIVCVSRLPITSVAKHLEEL